MQFDEFDSKKEQEEFESSILVDRSKAAAAATATESWQQQMNRTSREVHAQAEIDAQKYLKDCVELDPSAITEEFVRIAPDLAHWNEQFAVAHREYNIAKLQTDVSLADMYTCCRDRMQRNGGKTTEAQIDASVKADMSYMGIRSRVIDAEYKLDIIKGTCDAIRTKKEMLISLGATLRIEMQGDPTIRWNNKVV